MSKKQKFKSRSFESFRGEMLEKHPEIRKNYAELAAAGDALEAVRRKLRLQRNAAGLSQDEVAERLGISQPAVSRIERPGSGDIGLRTLFRYAAAIDCVPEISFRPKDEHLGMATGTLFYDEATIYRESVLEAAAPMETGVLAGFGNFPSEDQLPDRREKLAADLLDQVERMIANFHASRQPEEAIAASAAENEPLEETEISPDLAGLIVGAPGKLESE